MPVDNCSYNYSLKWAEGCDGKVENEDLCPFNISPEQFVWVHNLMLCFDTLLIGPLEKVVNNLHIVYGTIEHVEYYDFVYNMCSIWSNFGMMHEHKTGTDGNACSISRIEGRSKT